MKYAKANVTLPAGMDLGSEVYLSGEGDEVFTIIGIDQEDGRVTRIHTDSGCNESMSKICLVNPELDFFANIEDMSAWVHVEIGECDICGVTFPDSCVYNKEEGGDPLSMICNDCFAKTKPPAPVSPDMTLKLEFETGFTLKYDALDSENKTISCGKLFYYDVRPKDFFDYIEVPEPNHAIYFEFIWPGCEVEAQKEYWGLELFDDKVLLSITTSGNDLNIPLSLNTEVQIKGLDMAPEGVIDREHIREFFQNWPTTVTYLPEES